MVVEKLVLLPMQSKTICIYTGHFWVRSCSNQRGKWERPTYCNSMCEMGKLGYSVPLVGCGCLQQKGGASFVAVAPDITVAVCCCFCCYF